MKFVSELLEKWGSRKRRAAVDAVDRKKEFCRQMGIAIEGETAFDLENAFLDAQKKNLQLLEKRKSLEQEERRIKDQYSGREERFF